MELDTLPNHYLYVQYSSHKNAPAIKPGRLSVSGGDGGELNSEHGPTVADALRDLSIALDRLANILDEVNPNLLEP